MINSDEGAVTAMSRELQVAQEIESFVKEHGKYSMWIAFAALSDTAIDGKSSQARAWDVWSPEAARRVIRLFKEKGMHVDLLNQRNDGRWICIY